MDFVAALFIMTQGAAPMVAEMPSQSRVATRATVSARVLRPAYISLQPDAEPDETQSFKTRSVQRARDAAGTIWVEFS